MNISGKCKIYAKMFGERVAYSTAISSKNQDGTYENMYVNVQLPKDTILDDKTLINVKNGFLSNYKNKEGLYQVKLIIQEFEEIGSKSNVTTVNDIVNVVDESDDLPF